MRKKDALKIMHTLEQLVKSPDCVKDMVWQFTQDTGMTKLDAEQQYFRKFFINYNKTHPDQISYNKITQETYDQCEYVLAQWYKQGDYNV